MKTDMTRKNQETHRKPVESLRKKYGSVAQWIGHRLTASGVASSSPAGVKIYFTSLILATPVLYTRDAQQFPTLPDGGRQHL